MAGLSQVERLVLAMGAEGFYASLSEEEREELLHTWRANARPEQIAPAGDWRTWLVKPGRGWGKTRCGAEWVHEQALEIGTAAAGGIIAPTPGDARDLCIEGPSGLENVGRPDFRPHYEPSLRLVTFPNGHRCHVFSAADPGHLRGPNLAYLWGDEVAAWKRAQATYDMARFTLRVGQRPRFVLTSTPKPIKLIRDLVKASRDGSGRVIVTNGSSFDNAGNLAPTFLEDLITDYGGTRLGRQELYGDVLDDTPGALWTRATFEAEGLRVLVVELPELVRIVVGVDPAVSTGEGANHTGIVVVGIDRRGHLYVLADYSLIGTPGEWAAQVLRAYEEWDADEIVAEVNNGGDLVAANIRTHSRAVKVVNVRASRGKRTRAEPISALYEQRRVHHVRNPDEREDLEPLPRPEGMDPEEEDPTRGLEHLEDECCTWDPNAKARPTAEKSGDAAEQAADSPDRLDALVWAAWRLAVDVKDRAWIR